MKLSMLPDDPRLHELLAERALGNLTESEAQELAQLLAAAGVADDQSYELTAAMAAVSLVEREGAQDLPMELRRKLEANAQSWMTSGTEVVSRVDFRHQLQPNGNGGVSRWLPWLLAAACLGLAVVAWNVRPGSSLVTPEEGYRRVLAMNGTSKAVWGDFVLENAVPEIRDVHGEVIWNELAQAGYMKFENLPENDPGKEQYQLWIIDQRGLSQRISGGVFNVADAKGSAIVRIEPSLRIQGAAAFAVTIEPPGGNAVSDMQRRVCIASIK